VPWSAVISPRRGSAFHRSVNPVAGPIGRFETIPPFDLTDLRTVFYQLDLEHFEAAQTELRSHLQKALSGRVSPLDHALFSPLKSEGATGESQSSSRDLLAVLEVCESILKEAQETKESVGAVGQITLELKEDKEEQERLRQEYNHQEMGKFLMSQLFQNPDSAEKLLPALQKLAESGETQKLADQQRLREPSGLSQLNFGVDRLELAAGVVDLHLPVDAALETVEVG
jgi:hypothetical protein